MYKDKEVKNVKNIFVNVWRKNIFDIYVTEYGTALTTILPILFLYLNTVTVTAGTFEPYFDRILVSELLKASATWEKSNI
jgi:hypothetical protein